MTFFRCAVSVACASCIAVGCKASAAAGGEDCNDNSASPSTAPNCGLPNEHEALAVCCPTSITADSGPPSYEAALAGVSCGLGAEGSTCGTYRRVLVVGIPSEGPPAMVYYYDETGGTLLAVVQRADALGDTCVAGPSNFVEPCEETCTPLDGGSVPLAECGDAGD